MLKSSRWFTSLAAVVFAFATLSSFASDRLSPLANEPEIAQEAANDGTTYEVISLSRSGDCTVEVMSGSGFKIVRKKGGIATRMDFDEDGNVTAIDLGSGTSKLVYSKNLQGQQILTGIQYPDGRFKIVQKFAPGRTASAVQRSLEDRVCEVDRPKDIRSKFGPDLVAETDYDYWSSIDAWEPEANYFFSGWMSGWWAGDRPPLPPCAPLIEACKNECDNAGEGANILCGAEAAIAGSVNVLFGVAVGAACAGGVLLAKNNCKYNCNVPSTPCT
jgi:hypothetical protein